MDWSQPGKRSSYWIFLALGTVGFASAWFLGRDPLGFTLILCISTLFVSVAGFCSPLNQRPNQNVLFRCVPAITAANFQAASWE
jgi:hypothetical protein